MGVYKKHKFHPCPPRVFKKSQNGENNMSTTKFNFDNNKLFITTKSGSYNSGYMVDMEDISFEDLDQLILTLNEWWIRKFFKKDIKKM